MSDIVLKTANGIQRTYNGINVIKVPKSNGDTAIFSEVNGTLEITSTEPYDVSTYVEAQVVDSNLISSNIKSGVSILGVNGSFAGGGGSGGTNAVVLSNEASYTVYAKINNTPTDTSDSDYTLEASYNGVVPITVLDSNNSFVNVSKVFIWSTSFLAPMEKLTVFINDANVGTLSKNVIAEFEISTSSAVKIKVTY